MASAPIYLVTGFSIPVNVSTPQTKLDGTGAGTTIATAGASGGKFVGAELNAVTAVQGSDMIFFHKLSGGARTFIGKFSFPGTNPQGIGAGSQLGVFQMLGGPQEMLVGDTIECAPMTSCGTIAVRALGGSY